jgi:hypothetical protein
MLKGTLSRHNRSSFPERDPACTVGPRSTRYPNLLPEPQASGGHQVRRCHALLCGRCAPETCSRDGDVVLTLLCPDPEIERLPWMYGTAGPNHIGIETERAEEIQATLRENGYKVYAEAGRGLRPSVHDVYPRFGDYSAGCHRSRFPTPIPARARMRDRSSRSRDDDIPHPGPIQIAAVRTWQAPGDAQLALEIH